MFRLETDMKMSDWRINQWVIPSGFFLVMLPMSFSAISGWLLVLITTLAILYTGICFGLHVGQHRLIFKPNQHLKQTPADWGLDYQEVWLRVPGATGEDKIHGWWVPSPVSSSSVLLYLHGNGGNMGSNLNNIMRFQQLGFDQFLIDYRGYGLSKGKFPTESQVYEDAEIACHYLIEERGINPKDLFVFGHSLGGAIAIELATRHPKMAGLIVEGTFTSMPDVASYRQIYRLFPIGLLVHQTFDSISKLRDLKIPILFIHGSQDDIIPEEMSYRLFAVAGDFKELYIVPNGDHNHVAEIAGEAYLKQMERFIDQVKQRVGN